MSVQVGDRIRDNDPRMHGGRVLTVQRITEPGPFGGHQWAVCTRGCETREIRIRLDRIYTDGKPRRSGFTLLRGEPA